jgi:DNA-binding transcriptional ArsR family regulator
VLEPDPTAPATSLTEVPRWELYRLLADPIRVRLLALVADEELAVGELAELLGEGQPKISRHGASLRDAGLITARKHGTWVLYRIEPGVTSDPVVADALRAGRELCEQEGTRARALAVVRSRDARAREFFARANKPVATEPPRELGAYLTALSPLVSGFDGVAVDAGTGDGSLLDVLCPIFRRVIAVDRSEAQLRAARTRAEQHALSNVTFIEDELDGPKLANAVKAEGGADLMFVSRVLHHAPQPERAFCALASLLARPTWGTASGSIVVLDYVPHEDLVLKDAQADLWLGFSEEELLGFASAASLTRAQVIPIPPAFRGAGPDRELAWHALVAQRNVSPEDVARTEQQENRS